MKYALAFDFFCIASDFSSTRQGLCFDFQRGNCSRRHCRFRHEKETTVISSFSASPSTLKAPVVTELEAKCRQWTYMIPRQGNLASSRVTNGVDFKQFFQLGWSLINSGDASIQQHVINKLGTEKGLGIIKNLTELMEVRQNDTTTVPLFVGVIVPFYRIISHLDVLHSLVLETSVDGIYTFLFGPRGRRGLNAFEFTASALTGVILDSSAGYEEASTIALASSFGSTTQDD